MRFLRNVWVQRIGYTLIITTLIVGTFYQIYDLWSLLSTRTSDKPIMGNVEPEEEASILTPFEIFLTYDGETYARVTAMSGHYASLWSRTRSLIERMAVRDPQAVPVEEESTKGTIVLSYACPLEETVLSETLGIQMPGASVREIRVVPAASRLEKPALYFKNEADDVLYRVTGNVTYSTLSNRRLIQTFQELAPQLSYDHLNAAKRFPGRFDDNVYVKQLESVGMYYIPTVKRSFLDEDGNLDTEAAAAYCLHFFNHPDVAKAVEGSDNFVWYADEKRTVRYDTTGLLQYVATQEITEKTSVGLQEAFRLATGFLLTDLVEDGTRLQEVYLYDYEIEDGRYTFRWNYAYNHIPFAMNEENRTKTELSAPIEVIIEGSQVRYYHRYLLDKSMEADKICRIQETFIDALDHMPGKFPDAPIDCFRLEYAEEENGVVLYWRVDAGEESRRFKAQEVRV